MKILTISGSQRAASFNTMLVKALPALAPEGQEFTFLDYSAISLYNQDLEESFPENVSALKQLIRDADAVIISTPEYNRSMPAALKNVIDWTSRPYGDGVWLQKPVLTMGASPAPTGTALAQADLRKSLLFLDARVLGQPETYVGSAHEKFAADGTLTDESTKEHLRKALGTLAAIVSGK